jgi:hypothetical protein
LLAAAICAAAELRLRESLLLAQRDRISIAITAVVDHLGAEAHDLVDDCDIHVPLRSREIGVPVLGEVKNACSIPPGVPDTHWSDLLYQETHGLAVPVEGVFRIWLEHQPSGSAIQTEAERVPWYPHSNPDHQVELHPLTRVGSLDFRSHVARIENETEFFEGFGVAKLPTVLAKKITIQRVTADGQSFVRIKGTQTGFNHWRLRGRVLDAPEALADGLRIRLDILSATGTQVVPGALDIPAVALSGTVAHGKIQTLAAGGIIRFHALVRMRLGTVLDEVGATAKEIPLPIEFVLLDVE